MDDIIARYEHAYAHDIDAETVDRRRQQQPPADDRLPVLAAESATPENLAALGWTPEEAERLGIQQVLVPEGDGCPLCARHAASDKAVGAEHGGIHDVVYGNGAFSCRKPCQRVRGVAIADEERPFYEWPEPQYGDGD